MLLQLTSGAIKPPVFTATVAGSFTAQKLFPPVEHLFQWSTTL
jgi:hypothetical protein